MAGDLDPEGQILTRLVSHDRSAIDGPQDEGLDDAAFLDDILDPKIAPAVPAAGRLLLIVIDAVFAGNQDIGKEPVSLTPGGQDLVGRSITPRP
jgi:hypothetical protein